MGVNLTIEGVIENIIYQNEQNGYTVFSVLTEDSAELDGGKTFASSEITCTAYITGVGVGENVRLTGNFVVHPSYGRQFNVETLKRSAPTTVSGIKKYLGSGVIKGIGERLASRITDVFGDDTLKVIENAPEKLAAINGISLNKALLIGEIFREQASLRNVMLYLQEFGISPLFIRKIYNKYKDDSIDVVKKNPYILAEDIAGIGFKTADAIAFRAGIEPDSEFRVKAGIKYILQNAALQNGHVFMEKSLLVSHASEMLGIPGELADNCIMSLQFERQIFQENQNGETAVYLNRYYYAESYTAKRLIELASNTAGYAGDIDAEIDALENRQSLGLDSKFAENQITAIKVALTEGVLVITGGPGTGKTTVIKAILSLLKKRGASVELAAPTGRAAKRLEEATGMEAKTIHRLLGMTAGDDDANNQHFEKNEENLLEADVFIIDESSMVDIILMYNLLRAIPPGARLILAGDADQLPSVGPGNVLKDIINSNEIKVVKLTEIFRQSRESAIVMNAHRINSGERPVFNENGRDFFFLKRRNADDAVEAVKELVRSRLPKFAAASSLTDIQVLSPMRKSPLGSVNLNLTLQEALNPGNRKKAEKQMNGFVFREGDKVMQIKNNYNLSWRVLDGKRRVVSEGTGVYNGDEGIIVKIDNAGEILRVRFDGGREADYDFSRLEELELAYAVTIHKSQGSEYKVVVIPIHSGPPALMTRNLLYTAVTRAKELVVLVGVPETLYRMVENNREVRRFSALAYKICKIKGIMAQ